MSELIERVARALITARTPARNFTDNPYYAEEGWVFEPMARAAIAEVLDEVDRHLSAVQYSSAPYTDMKARLSVLRREAMGEGPLTDSPPPCP